MLHRPSAQLPVAVRFVVGAARRPIPTARFGSCHSLYRRRRVRTIMRLLAPRWRRGSDRSWSSRPSPALPAISARIEVAKAAPDGYTILVAATNNFVINQFTMKMPIDPLAALTPVAKLADVPLVLFSNPAVPAKNFAEFMDYAKANPGKLNYGSPAAGTVNHLLLERVKQTRRDRHAARPLSRLAARRAGAAQNDIQLFTVGLAAGAAHLKEGKLTALAVATRAAAADAAGRADHDRERASRVSPAPIGGAWPLRRARRTPSIRHGSTRPSPRPRRIDGD